LKAILFLTFILIMMAMCREDNTHKDISTNKINNDYYAVATFAGGCFWCMESVFDRLNGVVDVIAGYTGGNKENPTYKEVCSGTTGHLEAIQIIYDPKKINYKDLLNVFWQNIDPTDAGGQFIDRGPQYRTAIFFHDEGQKRVAEESKRALMVVGLYSKTIMTEILKFTQFYKAEDYHQDYYKTCPARYNTYKRNSGREQMLKKIWNDKEIKNIMPHYAKPSDEDLKARLTPLQYSVTQQCGTEPPFENEYWDNKREGIYVDVISGKPLFSSKDKYDSGSGWPSFTRPLEPDNIVERTDLNYGMTRIEVRSKHADSHLGHLFSDGREPTGLRYCINSAALRFIAKEDLEKEGYGEYLKLFSTDNSGDD